MMLLKGLILFALIAGVIRFYNYVVQQYTLGKSSCMVFRNGMLLFKQTDYVWDPRWHPLKLTKQAKEHDRLVIITLPHGHVDEYVADDVGDFHGRERA